MSLTHRYTNRLLLGRRLTRQIWDEATTPDNDSCHKSNGVEEKAEKGLRLQRLVVIVDVIEKFLASQGVVVERKAVIEVDETAKIDEGHAEGRENEYGYGGDSSLERRY